MSGNAGVGAPCSMADSLIAVGVARPLPAPTPFGAQWPDVPFLWGSLRRLLIDNTGVWQGARSCQVGHPVSESPDGRRRGRRTGAPASRKSRRQNRSNPRSPPSQGFRRGRRGLRSVRVGAGGDVLVGHAEATPSPVVAAQGAPAPDLDASTMGGDNWRPVSTIEGGGGVHGGRATGVPSPAAVDPPAQGGPALDPAVSIPCGGGGPSLVVADPQLGSGSGGVGAVPVQAPQGGRVAVGFGVEADEVSWGAGRGGESAGEEAWCPMRG